MQTGNKPKARKDPKPRHTEAFRFRLVNKRPDRVYVWVPVTNNGVGAANLIGVEYYENMGYNVVVSDKEGVRFTGSTCKPGETITHVGNVLMEIDKALHDEMIKEGQDYADRIQRNIVQKKGGLGLESVHGAGARSGFAVENNTKPQEFL